MGAPFGCSHCLLTPFQLCPLDPCRSHSDNALQASSDTTRPVHVFGRPPNETPCALRWACWASVFCTLGGCYNCYNCYKFRLGRIVWACRIQRGRAAPFDFFKRLPCIKPHGGHTSQRASFRTARNLAPPCRAVALQSSRAAPIGSMRPAPLGFRAMYWGQAAQHRAP